MIVMENVCKSYPKSGGRGAIRVLDGVSFHIHPREYAAFIGPSGSGKSTLLNLIGCLDLPTSGRYALDGVEVPSLGVRALSALRRDKIGFVFQGFQLLQKLTAWENVAFPLLLKGVGELQRREAAMETLRKVGIADRALHRPCQLSGGQQQRVAIARALCASPRLLLCDEPTAALDPATRDDLLSLFARLHQEGHTIVLITHDLSVARRAERRFRVDGGRVIEEDRSTSFAPLDWKKQDL